ncbi:MAG: endolytic transglycosylase MltG [Acidobacteria bacterium]|nr:endolytic transglycosylase MltG [Acidobacteriota bacterium]
MRRLTRWLLLGVLLLGAAGAATLFYVTSLDDPYRGWSGDEVFVEIPAGAGPRTIERRLIEAGVVKDAFTFRAALWLSGRARELQAGEYHFDRPLGATQVIEVIASGQVHKRLLTLREGLTIAEMAQVFEERGFGTAAAFIAAASDPSLIRNLDPGAPDLEGYLFPETYALPRQTPASDLVKLMVAHFEAAFDEPLRSAARDQGLTTRDVVTLASLVEKETGQPHERPLVAAVYRNRLKLGMGMQADPTVIFALQKAGSYDGNLSRDDLQFDSPYNTYRYPGLPPGPIAAPGRSALEATLRPADVKHLYFVSRNDGSHVFADTLEEHNRNVLVKE